MAETETGGSAGAVQAGEHNQELHSTLEVVPAQDYARADFNRNDKEAFVPCRDNDKLVVPPETYDTTHHDQANSGLWSPLTGLAQNGSVWDRDAGGSEGHAENGKKERICGIKRRTFFIFIILTALLVATGVGVGAGVGVSTTSRDSAEAQANATASASSSKSATPANTASQAPTSSAPQATASEHIGGPGGRCTAGWGDDCICLDENECIKTWNGTPQTGQKPNWPCPNDPANIKACYVHPCKNASLSTSRCLWIEGCKTRDLGTSALCPGGVDFICCDQLASG